MCAKCNLRQGCPIGFLKVYQNLSFILKILSENIFNVVGKNVETEEKKYFKIQLFTFMIIIPADND